MGVADRIYARLPVWAQHATVSAYGLYWNRLRFGGRYEQHLAEYRAREQLDAEGWSRWRSEALRRVLSAAADHVPYYRDTWSADQKREARAGNLQALPLLSKEPLRADPRAFIREDMRPLRQLVHHTSGSTGTPIASIWTVDEYRSAVAIREIRSAGWANVSYTMPRATFSGRIVEPDPESRGPFHRFNAVERQVYLSAFHLRRDTAPAYVEALRKHKVRWLTGYAVSYYLLARFILEEKLRPPPLDAVITTSEKLTTSMREAMERAYGCRVFEEYSTVENALFVSECERGRLHVSEDCGIIELLRDDGTPAAPGDEGAVVATCLMRSYQPLIRFRIGDVAVWDPRSCPCGRAMPVLREVVGRLEDVIVGPDGRQMVRFHGIFTDQPRVREAQVIQETLQRIRVKVAAAPGFGSTDTANITARMHQRLGPGVEIVVEVVDSIPRTKAGKYQAVVSLLPRVGVVGQTTGAT